MEKQQRQIKAMAKKQAEMEEQMWLFMQFERSGNQTFGENVVVGGAPMNEENDNDIKLDNFPI